MYQTIHLVNRRPIAFKESLRENSSMEDMSAPITPEILLKGHELTSLNLILELQRQEELDITWTPSNDLVKDIKDNYNKLNIARNHLKKIYNEEFDTTLINQAINTRDKYKPK